MGKTAFGAGCTEYQMVNRELYRYAEENPDCYYVTGKNLESNADGIHINAQSQRRFGLRYFEAYNTKCHITEPLKDEKRRTEELYKREHTEAEKKYIALEQFMQEKISFEEVMKFLM